MKCKRAKQEMALSAGRDLDPVAEQELRRHLTGCPGCQDQWNRIHSATAILHQVSVEEAEVPAPQLWSSVSRSIQAASGRQNARSESTFFSHGLVPLVAVASLMLAVVSIQDTLNNRPPQESKLLPVGPSFKNASSASIVEHPNSPFEQHFSDEEDSSLVLPPRSPIERYLHDREGYQQTPAPRQRIESLPGGDYLWE